MVNTIKIVILICDNKFKLITYKCRHFVPKEENTPWKWQLTSSPFFIKLVFN